MRQIHYDKFIRTRLASQTLTYYTVAVNVRTNERNSQYWLNLLLRRRSGNYSQCPDCQRCGPPTYHRPMCVQLVFRSWPVHTGWRESRRWDNCHWSRQQDCPLFAEAAAPKTCFFKGGWNGRKVVMLGLGLGPIFDRFFLWMGDWNGRNVRMLGLGPIFPLKCRFT